MKNIQKDIPQIVGLIATTSLALITGGVVNPAITSIGAGLATNILAGFTPDKVRKMFVTEHPDKLNHSIKKLFVASVSDALGNINVLFSETNYSVAEKKIAKGLIKILQRQLPSMLMSDKHIQLEESEIKHFLYEKGKEEAICRLIENEFSGFGIAEPFKSFLAKNLPAQIQLCFGEGLKDPANQHAWVAFQRMLMEEIRDDIKQLADTQQSIKDDLSDLKFTKTGFSKKQLDEVHKLVKILNNKKLFEVKITDGISQSLQSIEEKANEIIQITTQTNLTVSQLKTSVEKIKQQNKTTQIIIFSLAACLLIAGFFILYKTINQPFTLTVQLYGWESEQHNPLGGKGTLVLTVGDKIEQAPINQQGEAIFKNILPQFNGKSVSAYIADTEGEPYYLSDSILTIQKNNTTKVQVLLRGLEKLQGTVYDNISEEGLPDASVTIAEITVKTDEKGNFTLEIPIEKQGLEQEVEVSKIGYKSKRQTIPMSGEGKFRTILERQ